MKKYTLRIVYNEETDVGEKVEETIADMDSIPKILSIGDHDLMDYLTIEEWDTLNNCFNGETFSA